MNTAHPFLTKLASALAVFVLVMLPVAQPLAVFAEETEAATSTESVGTTPPADVCPNVAGDQPEGTPCADAECASAGGTWENQSCAPPGPTPEQQCLIDGGLWEGSACVMPQTSAATTTAASNAATSTATSTPPDGNPALIQTGSASSTAEGTGIANVSDITASTTATTTIETENAATGTMAVHSVAETGENAILDGDGGIIDTGSASAFSWVMSLFNVAIVNSTGSIHFYRNPVGDALNFTQRFLDAFSEIAQNGLCSLTQCEGLDDVALTVYDENIASVQNVAVARSDTGENNCEGAICDIETGDADAMAGIVNVGNLTMVDSRYLLLFMANEGDLNGDILVPEPSFFSTLSTGAHLTASSSVAATSSATLNNIAGANAETGGNSATTTGGALIETGDAIASAADINFVNQLGAPICFVVAVGGAWNGAVWSDGAYQLPPNFSQADAPFGSIICGEGGAERDPVSNTQLEVVNYAEIFNAAIAEAITGHNEAEGLVARMKTGDARAFAEILNLVDVTLIGQDWVFANFAVSGDWNGDLVFGHKPEQEDIWSAITGGLSGVSSVWYRANPRLSITKTAEVETAQLPAQVAYTITIMNESGHAQDAVVRDTLTGPDGTTIGEQQWELDEIASGEEITITYTLEFKGDLAPGYYTNTAKLFSENSAGGVLDPLIATDVVEILPGGEVLGTDTCAPVLTQYIKPGRANDKGQVRALQAFLNAFEGANLAEDGTYAGATVAAVRAFQQKYAADILAPWGISAPTGNVYYTTQKKVNELACGTAFPLSAAQEAEIASFRQAPAREQEKAKEQGRTGLAPTNLLQFPFFDPNVFKDAWSAAPRPVGQVQTAPASTSALLKEELKKTPLWAMFAPFVDALER